MEEQEMAAHEKVEGKPKTSSGPTSSPSTPKPIPPAALLAFTLDTSTGHIIRVERVDSSGTRQELSAEEKAGLAKDNGAVLNGIVEKAFEAGIACVLGAHGDEQEPPESVEEARLRHLLLQPLIEDSAAKDLIQRDVPSRAVLDILIQHAANPGGPGATGRSTS
jgi:hypothetical protein